MAIHRVTHKGNYTVIDNEIIRGSHLTATAKTVLMVCLSLPDNWKFNIRGLCAFCAEGPDAVARAIKELEDAGYVERRRVREKGKIMGIEYDIYETPQQRDVPDTADPDPEKPDVDKQNEDIPDQDQEVQSNTNPPSTSLPNIYDTNNQSINQTDVIEDKLRKQIEYDIMCQRYDSRLLDDIVSVMASAIMAKGDTVSVGRDKEYPAEYVRFCLNKINSMHIEQLMETLTRNQPTIRHVRAYLLTALINAANTMDMGYQYGDY